MDKPVFKNGQCVIKGYHNKSYTLIEKTWQHIVKDRGRSYIENHFGKVVKVLKSPEWILQSPKEKHVMAHVRRFDDFYILNTVFARVYLYIVINMNNDKIRTIYTNPSLKSWEQVWPEK